MCFSVNHGEKVRKTIAGGKRAHKIQVNLGELSRRNRDGRYRNVNMGLDLALRTMETRMSPETHISGHPRPNELC